MSNITKLFILVIVACAALYTMVVQAVDGINASDCVFARETVHTIYTNEQLYIDHGQSILKALEPHTTFIMENCQ